MKAALLKGYGSVDMLELGDHEAPEPKANEIQVRVEGASINPIDWKLRRGDMKGMSIPIARRFPLADIREAQKLAEHGGIGKMLLTL